VLLLLFCLLMIPFAGIGSLSEAHAKRRRERHWNARRQWVDAEESWFRDAGGPIVLRIDLGDKYDRIHMSRPGQHDRLAIYTAWKEERVYIDRAEKAQREVKARAHQEEWKRRREQFDQDLGDGTITLDRPRDNWEQIFARVRRLDCEKHHWHQPGDVHISVAPSGGG
jgi:hypothetical protein